MGLYSFYRISKPSADKVPEAKVHSRYITLRRQTFWATVIAYSLYYVCRMSLSVVKQPIIDSGVLTPGELGLIGSAFLFVYAAGKFTNGFIADYCNIRRFMATGLLVSSVINLLMGISGLLDGAAGVVSVVLFLLFAILWGINGWAQSMGSPPGVIQLSRWFPMSKRGTYYSIFSSTPYIGEFLAFIIVGAVVGSFGWQFGFVFAAVAGFIGSAVILLFVSDTPESKGLPSIQSLSGEAPREEDSMPTVKLQKMILSHPGIWIIAASSAFVYITKYAVAGWGVLFLQKAKDFSLENATQIIAFSAAFGVLGTVIAGWLSDTVFKGDRIRPAILSGLLSFVFLGLFLFTEGSYIVNIAYVSMFSLFIGVLYCIVAGLMAIDIVPRKATGAALGVVGISSYAAAGLQDITSGYLIQGFSEAPEVIEGMTEAEILAATSYDFGPVSVFWLVASLVAFLLPVLMWKKMKVTA
ncbi:MAG: MFS transporter [Bacteroidetes bacterium]|uniref:MFS transporter n=1 Tax=Candidatus Cryptobacteroides faecigallinarum TaxID=2840763 RepID=A0A9D9IJM3_9BACT|nr:MFS transporter [Candidatus Cryptobacteroides faecigallinarum]